MKKAIVIGSGIAGLASALRLKAKSYHVTVFESNAYAGGKLHAFEKDGFRFDMGPSLFTMPHLVDELFELFGQDPREHFNYLKKEDICHYFWEDHSKFYAPASRRDFIDSAATFFEESPDLIEQYLKRSSEKLDLTYPVFLEKSLHKLSTYFSGSTLRAFLNSSKLDILSSLNETNERSFSNSKLIQLFNRYATYNGSSPYQTPGIMSMIPDLEMRGGTYYPEGGMHEISQSLYRLAKRSGVEFHFSEPVKEILHKGNSVLGVQTSQDEYLSDIVVSNADVFTTYQHLIHNLPKPKKTLNQERSSSALIFYWGINRVVDELDLHNILFSDHYREEFSTLFNDHWVHADPTIYINITSKEDAKDAPAGCENWFVMVNAPGNFGQDWDQLKMEVRANIITKIKRILDIDVEKHLLMEEVLDPIKIEANTSSHRGSLYGTSSNSRFAAFLRHANFSNRLKNLYFCGGSVHPGGGIPLCLLSAKIMTNLITQ